MNHPRNPTARMIASLILWPLCLPAPALAADQQLYFHLHQAYEFFEKHVEGRCPSASTLAREHLIAADVEAGRSPSIFEPSLAKLWALHRGLGAATLAKVEAVRAEVQSLADAAGLKHHKTWHEELRRCDSNGIPSL